MKSPPSVLCSSQPTCRPPTSCMGALMPSRAAPAQAVSSTAGNRISQRMSDVLGQLGGEADVRLRRHGQKPCFDVVGDLEILDELAHGLAIHAASAGEGLELLIG